MVDVEVLVEVGRGAGRRIDGEGSRPLILIDGSAKVRVLMMYYSTPRARAFSRRFLERRGKRKLGRRKRRRQNLPRLQAPRLWLYTRLRHLVLQRVEWRGRSSLGQRALYFRGGRLGLKGIGGRFCDNGAQDPLLRNVAIVVNEAVSFKPDRC